MEKVEKSEQKFFPRLGRKLSLGSVFKPFCFVSIFSESNQIGSIEVEKMQILKIKLQNKGIFDPLIPKIGKFLVAQSTSENSFISTLSSSECKGRLQVKAHSHQLLLMLWHVADGCIAAERQKNFYHWVDAVYCRICRPLCVV